MTQHLSFRYSSYIPFHLADPAGILFFGHAFTLAHQAYEQFITQQLSFSWNQWFQNPDWIVPIKHAEAQFSSPLLAGQEVVMEVLIKEVAISSFIMETAFYQNRLCCTVKTVHVFCSRLNREKIPIPGAFLSLLHSPN